MKRRCFIANNGKINKYLLDADFFFQNNSIEWLIGDGDGNAKIKTSNGEQAGNVTAEVAKHHNHLQLII